MNDSESLKSRSIELAERAYRLKDRAKDLKIQRELHEAANNLILLEDSERFYKAQEYLEEAEEWTEDERALGHEINVADKALRNIEEIDSITVLKIMETWSDAYAQSPNPETQAMSQSINNALDVLISKGTKVAHKNALNYLLSVIEALLSHSQKINSSASHGINTTVLTLRNMRDSILMARELIYDEAELLEQYKNEGDQTEALTLARHTLEEIYNTIQPTK